MDSPRVNTAIDRAEQWLAARRAWVILVIVVVAAALRAIYFVQLAGGPLMVQHRWDQSDMSHFDHWARAIAAGDVLSANVEPPLHQWHLVLAEEHFEARPGDPALDAAGEPGDEHAAARALWNRWCGGGRFYQDGFYPYFVATAYAIFGPDVRRVFLLQSIAGVCTVLLIHVVTRRLFGDLAGAVAALAAILYGPLLCYDMILLRDGLVALAGLAVVWLLDRAIRRPAPLRWGLCGATMGLAFLLKAHFALFIAGAALMLGWTWRRNPKLMARWGLPLLAGIVLAVAPLVARNLAVGVPPLSTASGGAPTFVIANGPQATATRPDLEGAGRILGETGARFLPAATRTLASHPDPGSSLGLLWSRFRALWHWYEVPNNENFYWYRLHAPVIGLTFLDFRVVAPLSLLGLMLGLGAWSRAWPLYGMALTHAVAALMVLPLGRFRLAFAVALLPFAAMAVTRLARWVAEGHWIQAAAATGAMLLVAFSWTGTPLAESRTLVRPVDCMVAWEQHYQPRLQATFEDQAWDGSQAIFKEALSTQPRSVREMASGQRGAVNRREAALAMVYAQLFEGFANVLELSGDASAAEGPRARASALRKAAEGQLESTVETGD